MSEQARIGKRWVVVGESVFECGCQEGAAGVEKCRRLIPEAREARAAVCREAGEAGGVSASTASLPGVVGSARRGTGQGEQDAVRGSAAGRPARRRTPVSAPVALPARRPAGEARGPAFSGARTSVSAERPRSARIDERLLVAIRDAPPDATASAIARAMGLSPSRLSKLLVTRGARLGLRNGTPRQILQHIRANLDAVALGFTGRDAAALDPGEGSVPLLNERDEQLIGSILTHPRADLTALARFYGHPAVSLRHWVNSLGVKLGAVGAAAEVVVHVRENSDSILRRARLDADMLPELPLGATAELTERDKQLIGSILGNPGMTLHALARHHGHPGSTMVHRAEGLARRLGLKARAAVLVEHVHRNGDALLERAGLDPENLPRLP